MKVNEEEAINITIEHGYDGQEFNTSTWKQRGCLKPNGSLKALIEKLETIFHQVEVEDKGKKRQYILSNKKEEVTERVLNYKGSVRTEEDEVMKEYIFNKLLENRGSHHSYTGWSDIIEIPNARIFPADEMIRKLKNLHSGFPIMYNPKEAVSEFIKALNTRGKNVIEHSFKRLQAEGRIDVTDIYCFKQHEGKVKIVSQDDYEEAQGIFREFLDSKDITYYSYTQSQTNVFKTNRNKEIINEAEEFLRDFLGIEFFFKSFKVMILNETIHNEITTQDFEAAYYKRFVTLTQQRQAKDKYSNSLSFWKRFYLLNTLTLLDYMGINNFEELLIEEKRSRMSKVEEFHDDHIMEVEARQAFGKKYIKK